MNKWELTRYLIDAKKCVDSVLFIAAYGDELRYIDLRKKISELRSEFSIKCCVVIDKHLERVKATPHNTTPTKENILGAEQGQGCALKVFARTN